MTFLIGLAAGGFGGLVGIGGGVIMVPLMVGLLKMEQHMAHGTSLVALVFTGLAGTVVYLSKGSVDLLASLILASAAVFTARTGAGFANALPAWKLKRFFGGFLFVAVILVLLKSLFLQMVWLPAAWEKVLILLLAGSLTGFLSGMLGIGGGTVMVPLLVLFAGFDQYTAQGVSLLTMIPVGLVGAYTHRRFGNISNDVLPGLVPGILGGALLGGFLAHSLPELALRLLFAAVLLWTGIKYIRTPRPAPKN